jgi:hypothetical protein
MATRLVIFMQKVMGSDMGWTGTQWHGSGTRKNFLIHEFNQESDTHKWWLSDVSMRGAVAYCIYWQLEKATGKQTHEGMVILTEKRKDEPYWIFYKEIGESCLPYYYDAPVSLIKKLNELGEPCNDNARQWRDRCLESAEKAKIKVELGTIIEFLKPMKFVGSGQSFEESKFVVCEWRGRKSFRTYGTGQLCSIPSWKKKEYRVVGVQ